MPVTRDPRIDAYIKEAEPFARPILKHLRKLVHQGCPQVIETIKWHSPFFMVGKKNVCFMAGFKAHCGFGFWGPKMRKVVVSKNAKANPGMGNFGRLTTLKDLPTDRQFVGYVREATRLAKPKR